jgi:FKBP-type peptidyl-prolyl cis-trans isomerase FkpA
MFKNFKAGLILLFGVAVFSQACNSNDYETTNSGLKYKFIKDAKGDKLEEGKILIVNMAYYTDKDSALFKSSDFPYPVSLPYQDSIWTQSGMIFEGFKMLKKGDSLEFRVPAKDLFEKSFQTSIPEGINKDSEIRFNVGVVDILDEEGFMAWQMEQFQKEQQKAETQATEQISKDAKIIDDYLKENNIVAKNTESGLRYVIKEEGKGVKPEAGNTVSVHYKGTLLDGTPFDSSFDRNEPLSFQIGMGQVIPGWDEGISILNKGSKATLFIPSSLAYGSRGAGPVIQPNSILVFDVELVDVKTNN